MFTSLNRDKFGVLIISSFYIRDVVFRRIAGWMANVVWRFWVVYA